MARFQFRWSARPHPVIVRRTLAALREADGDAPSPQESLASGPGWFDSSWDLRRGLEVREGLPANASVSEWLASTLVDLPALQGPDPEPPAPEPVPTAWAHPVPARAARAPAPELELELELVPLERVRP